MNKTLPLVLLLALTGCATTTLVPEEVEAVRDFVAANELTEVDDIRFFSSLRYTYVNDYFVTVPSRRGDYLVEFSSRCRAVGTTEFTRDMVDVRRESNTLRAKFDTIRGCRIGTIYEITKEQRQELEDLGDAPGEEVFLPDEEQQD